LLRLCRTTALRCTAIYAAQKRDAATLPTSTTNEPRVQADLREKRRGGTAQQYHAYKKYKKAVAVAVEKRADDTKRSDVLHIMEVAG